jgi:voltage-gated potassium channel
MNSAARVSSLIMRRLATAIAVVAAAIALGTIGFYFIEGFSLLDSVYLATETVTTVGYGDITPKTSSGRIFSIGFMLLGGGTVLYALTILVQAIVQAEILTAIGSTRKRREMEKLSGHFIICGAGRVGRRIIRQLERQAVPFVAIDPDVGKLEELIEARAHVIQGDATLEETLRRAGVERAQGLAACLADDAGNVYVVLTARGLNAKLHIVARAVEEEAEPKLIRAGANRVIAPTIIGGLSMARSLVKPAIADFMDSIVAESLGLAFEEIAIGAESSYAGKALKDTNIRSELDLAVMAVRRITGEMLFQPSGDTIIREGDLLIVIGKAEAMASLGATNK